MLEKRNDYVRDVRFIRIHTLFTVLAGRQLLWRKYFAFNFRPSSREKRTNKTRLDKRIPLLLFKLFFFFVNAKLITTALRSFFICAYLSVRIFLVKPSPIVNIH